MKVRSWLAIGCLACLVSCSDEALIEKSVSDLNARIDKLDIMSEEILVRAASMNELELTVSAMEDRQTTRLRNIIAREKLAEKRVIELDAEINEMEAKIKKLEADSNVYPKTLAEQKQRTEARLNTLLSKIEKTVDLSARPGEKKVVVLERLIEKAEALTAENKKLKAELEKK